MVLETLSASWAHDQASDAAAVVRGGPCATSQSDLAMGEVNTLAQLAADMIYLLPTSRLAC